MADPNQYGVLVTSEHNQQPNFMAELGLLIQPSVDLQNQFALFAQLFDIAQAVGDQLDKIGVWVGISRNLPVIGVLSDGDYVVLLQAVIAANHWDGTIPGAYAIWAIVFAIEHFQILIQDFQDMTMAVILLTTFVSPGQLALLTGGYIALRPAGVKIVGYFEPGQANSPIFGSDVENSTISGFDVGYWAIQVG